ncbi:unnamed protein product [Absidia cylindrospora]
MASLEVASYKQVILCHQVAIDQLEQYIANTFDSSKSFTYYLRLWISLITESAQQVVYQVLLGLAWSCLEVAIFSVISGT